MSRCFGAALAVVLSLGMSVLLAPSSLAQGERSLEVSPGQGKIGDVIVVRLDGWDAAGVTVTMCGNLARRGAPDCDVSKSIGIALSRLGSTLGEVRISAPPTTCPCVVRAANNINTEEQITPLVIAGHPVGPVVGPTTPKSLAEVSAKVTEVRRGLGGQLRPLLGGRRDYRVAVTIRNISNITLSKMFLSTAVGRTPEEVSPVPVPEIEPLKPGESRTYEVPTAVGSPDRGRYLWDVTLNGAGPLVTAQTAASSVPWLLYLLGLILAVDLFAFAVVQAHRRREQDEADGEVEETEDTEEIDVVDIVAPDLVGASHA